MILETQEFDNPFGDENNFHYRSLLCVMIRLDFFSKEEFDKIGAHLWIVLLSRFK